MNEQKKYPEPVEALVLILAIFALFIIAVVIYNLLNGADLKNPDEVGEGSRYLILFGSSLFLIIPLYYAYIKKYAVTRLFRFKAIPYSVVFFSILIGLTVGILSDELERLINMVFPVPDWILEMTQPLQVKHSLDWLLVIGGAVFITGFAEEALFRGFLQTALERKGDVTRAVILSSLTWTLIHSNPYWAVSIFITGIILGYLSWRSDSVLPSFIVHATNNFLALLFINLDMSSVQEWYESGEHVSPIVLLISAFLLVWSIKQVAAVYTSSSN